MNNLDLCPTCGAYWQCVHKPDPLGPEARREVMDEIFEREEGEIVRTMITEKILEELNHFRPPTSVEWVEENIWIGG